MDKKQIAQIRKQFQSEALANGGNIKEVDGLIPFHDFTEEPVVVGNFVEIGETTGKFGKSETPIINVDGNLKKLPSHAQLISKLKQLKSGAKVYIELTGVEPTDNGNMTTYDVLTY